MKKLKKKMTRCIVVVILIACALCVAYVAQRIMRYMACRKVSGTWRGNRIVGKDEFNYSFTLNDDGTFDYKEYKNGSLERTLKGNYTFKNDWVVMNNENNTFEVLEYWYKEGTLYNDGTAYTK